MFAKIRAMIGHVLDLYCVGLTNAALFWENYTKLYFYAKHLEKGLNGCGVRFLVFDALFSKKVPFFHKKCHFWPISNAAQNF